MTQRARDKIADGLNEALAFAKGKARMVCWACGTVVTMPELRCDCTKLGTGTQRLVPLDDGESGDKT